MIKTIYHPRKSLLFDTDVWVKRDSPGFQDTMDSHEGVELRELVDLYLLDLLTKEFGVQNIGLFKDDAFNCFENKSGPSSGKKIWKKDHKILKRNRLSIILEFYLNVADFFDVT